MGNHPTHHRERPAIYSKFPGRKGPAKAMARRILRARAKAELVRLLATITDLSADSQANDRRSFAEVCSIVQDDLGWGEAVRDTRAGLAPWSP